MIFGKDTMLYATHVHGGQVRKETTIPYIAHLLAVAATVLEYGGSDIVHACSDSVVNAAAGQQKEEWRTRKTRYIEHLKNG
jgi:(p)ppGpp synthase/HD superfamily hydrolase